MWSGRETWVDAELNIPFASRTFASGNGHCEQGIVQGPRSTSLDPLESHPAAIRLESDRCWPEDLWHRRHIERAGKVIDLNHQLAWSEAHVEFVKRLLIDGHGISKDNVVIPVGIGIIRLREHDATICVQVENVPVVGEVVMAAKTEILRAPRIGPHNFAVNSTSNVERRGEAARLLGMSRTRMTQVANLTALSPTAQETILMGRS